jgi:expansin (peptidoglycan-binding protein)
MSLVGSVGVIFAPTAGTVLSVSNDDSGSLTWTDGSEGSAGTGLSAEAFSDSFNVANGRYNEWRVKGAPIIGIFVADPNNIQVKRLQAVRGPDATYMVVGLDHISLDEVAATFAGQPVFTMLESGPVKLR